MRSISIDGRLRRITQLYASLDSTPRFYRQDILVAIDRIESTPDYWNVPPDLINYRNLRGDLGWLSGDARGCSGCATWAFGDCTGITCDLTGYHGPVEKLRRFRSASAKLMDLEAKSFMINGHRQAESYQAGRMSA